MNAYAWTTDRTDTEGQDWTFMYTGGTYIRIRPTAVRDWTNTIDLNYHGITPDQVTLTWLDARATTWINDRNTDLAAGNL